MRPPNPRDGLRAVRAVEALRLRATGMKIADIATAMSISRSYTNDLILDPTGEATRARKASYAGSCEVCGKHTDGSNGRRSAPSLCLEHSLAKQHDERPWNRETVLAALRQHVERYGSQPISSDFLHRVCDPDMPSVFVVQREFGSWSAAMHALGFESYVGIKPRSTRKDGMATYKIIEQENGDGTWKEVGEGEGGTQADALRAFLKGEPSGREGRFVVIPGSSWNPRRVKLIMQPSLITIPD